MYSSIGLIAFFFQGSDKRDVPLAPSISFSLPSPKYICLRLPTLPSYFISIYPFVAMPDPAPFAPFDKDEALGGEGPSAVPNRIPLQFRFRESTCLPHALS